MSWQLLTGLSVVLYSVNALLHRTIMRDEQSDAYAQALVFTGLGSLFFLVALLIRGGLESPASWNQLLLVMLAALLSAVGMVLVFEGFKSIGASEHTILLTSAQLWLMLGAVLILNEELTMRKVIGAAAILAGVVIAQWGKRALVLNRGAVCVLLAAFCFAASGTVSFLIVRSFDVLSYMFYGSVMVASMLAAFRPRVFRKLSFYFEPKRALNIVTTSFNDALANLFGLTAYEVGRNALQLSPIGATQTLLTVLLAIAILKERDHMTRKIAGGLAGVIGTILLL
jgi:drug/metabolite transporter (DMT)-like permease